MIQTISVNPKKVVSEWVLTQRMTGFLSVALR